MVVRSGFLINGVAPRQIHDVSFFANVLYSSFVTGCCYRTILGCSSTQINNKLLSSVSTSKDMFQLPFEISLQILAWLSLVSLHNEANSSVSLAPKHLIAFLAGDTVFFFSYFFVSFIMFTLSDSLSRRQEKWYWFLLKRNHVRVSNGGYRHFACLAAFDVSQINFTLCSLTKGVSTFCFYTNLRPCHYRKGRGHRTTTQAFNLWNATPKMSATYG